jgi:hypothetical protein
VRHSRNWTVRVPFRVDGCPLNVTSKPVQPNRHQLAAGCAHAPAGRASQAGRGSCGPSGCPRRTRQRPCLLTANVSKKGNSASSCHACRAVSPRRQTHPHRPRRRRPRPGNRQEHHPRTRRNPHPHPPGRRRAPRHGATPHCASNRRRCLRSHGVAPTCKTRRDAATTEAFEAAPVRGIKGPARRSRVSAPVHLGV